ncbi:MAG: multifunctional 2',3'-cyclic-nucleotide 2'-phosphodiesterase/5'-nucleotidase/3'-nucleotidase, partial [Phototrophicales bacterium]
MRFFVSLAAVALLAANVSAQDTFRLTVLHTNDQHAAHEPFSGGNGGVARQATVQNQIMAEGGNVLLLDAGDRFTGSLFHQQYRGQDQVQLMNALGYNAMTLGNHEFDDGEDVLLAFLQGLTFPVVTANVDFTAFPEIDALVSPYAVLEVGGQQIGVVGLTTADSVVTSSPSRDIIFSDDYAGAVAGAVAELTDIGINKIILLTHIGIDLDRALLESLAGVDLVLGGHSHTLLSNTLRAGVDVYPIAAQTSAGEPIYYAQAGSNNVYLGRLDVTFDAAGVVTAISGEPILLSRYITPDADIQAILTELAGPIEELRATPIGATASNLLVGDRTVCRVEECVLGTLLADAMLAEARAQIAITNGGGIRADIDAGEITLGEILTVLPFGNLASTVDLTGAQVIQALENGVSRITVENGQVVRAGASGRFPQVAGIRYSYDPTQPAGSRIVSVEVRGEDGSFSPLDPEVVYKVVTNDFMLSGGDGYSVFASGANTYA